MIIYLTGNKELRLIMISVYGKGFYLKYLKILCLGEKKNTLVSGKAGDEKNLHLDDRKFIVLNQFDEIF